VVGRRRRAAGGSAPGRKRPGLAIDRGVHGEFPSRKPAPPGIYAAGDIARWAPIRIPAKNHPRRALGGGPNAQGQTASRATWLGGAAEAFRRRAVLPGASITTCRSIMSVTPKSGTRSPSDGDIAAKDCLLPLQERGTRPCRGVDLSPDVASPRGELAMEKAAPLTAGQL